MASRMNQDNHRQGKVLSIRGSVVDVHFPDGPPAINSQLMAGEDGGVVIEVVSHLSATVVRGIALTPSHGLARGSTVEIGRAHV